MAWSYPSFRLAPANANKAPIVRGLFEAVSMTGPSVEKRGRDQMRDLPGHIYSMRL
jgi:hypothetical protein